jgi:hypothetical protein
LRDDGSTDVFFVAEFIIGPPKAGPVASSQ